MPVSTGHFDPNDKEYQVGDLVMNELFGDVWLVDYWQPEDNPEPDDTEFCFVQYCMHDLTVIDIAEPEGFTIIARLGDDEYQKLYEECLATGKKIAEGW